jgi:protein-disulfide isomerase
MKPSILGAVAAVAIGLGGYVTFFGGSSGSVPMNPLASAANAQTAAEIDTSTIVEMSIGNPDAPVTVIEYASYTCPHCARFHEGTFKQLKSDYIDTGKINFIYREVYFDRYGLWASAIARCAGPEKFFGISDLIYSGQSEWTRAGEAPQIVDELRKIGRLAGLESDQIEACLQDGEKLQTLVAWFQENAQADNIDSTPSFIINGEKYGNMPYPQFKDTLDEAAGS